MRQGRRAAPPRGGGLRPVFQPADSGAYAREIAHRQAELQALFEDCGFDAGTLPGIDFDSAVQAFVAAFDNAAEEEALLRPLLQFAEQRKQSALQGEMAKALRHEGHDRHYLNTLIEKCDPLDLSPIEETHPQGGHPGEARVVGISNVYTELYLARSTLADLLEGKRGPISALEAVAAMPRLVLLGQPGGGKSSLVNYLVVQLALRYLGEEGQKLPGWDPSRKPLPVRIVLRQFAAYLGELADGVNGDCSRG